MLESVHQRLVAGGFGCSDWKVDEATQYADASGRCTYIAKPGHTDHLVVSTFATDQQIEDLQGGQRTQTCDYFKQAGGDIGYAIDKTERWTVVADFLDTDTAIAQKLGVDHWDTTECT
ncbi:MAG: hypothetical protein QM757_14725 [Paludibaculum sp.]